MASNNTRYIDNIYHKSAALEIPGLLKAGSDQLIKAGEILHLDTGYFIPLDADQSNSAILAIAACDIKVGDLAGYYPIIIPRPGDRFIFALDTANNPAITTALYYSSSEELSESGSQALGYVVDHNHYPRQTHASESISSDAGTTLSDRSNIIMSFKLSTSYYAAIWI